MLLHPQTQAGLHSGLVAGHPIGDRTLVGLKDEQRLGVIALLAQPFDQGDPAGIGLVDRGLLGS
jgi:hypothetical protein